MFCSAAIYTFPAVTTYMNGRGRGVLQSLGFSVTLCYVSGAMSVVQLGWNQSIIQFSIEFFISKLFI